MIDVVYFSDRGVCEEDFENELQYIKINPAFIVSLSELINHHDTLPSTIINKYSELTMSNGDVYCIKENEYDRLFKLL